MKKVYVFQKDSISHSVLYLTTSKVKKFLFMRKHKFDDYWQEDIETLLNNLISHEHLIEKIKIL